MVCEKEAIKLEAKTLTENLYSLVTLIENNQDPDFLVLINAELDEIENTLGVLEERKQRLSMLNVVDLFKWKSRKDEAEQMANLLIQGKSSC